MNARKWFRDYRGFLLVTLILIVSSPVFTEIIPNPHFSNWNKGILTAGVVILAIVATKGDAARLSAERRLQNTRDQWDREQAEKYRHLNGRALLLQRVSEELGEAIAETRDALGALDLDRSTETVAAARRHCIKASLKSLCKVLEAGTPPRESEPLQAIIFKATLFEFSKDNEGNGHLERRYWHYPATIQPRTSKWDIVNDSNATAVQSYLRRQEVILESVKKAAKSGEAWKDSRPGQHREYEKSSMICVPVWAETNAADPDNSTVRAIVTVDTNQIHFFPRRRRRKGISRTNIRPIHEPNSTDLQIDRVNASSYRELQNPFADRPRDNTQCSDRFSIRFGRSPCQDVPGSRDR